MTQGRAAGIMFFLAGVALFVMPAPFVKGPELRGGLLSGLLGAEVVFRDDVREEFMGVGRFRQAYPMYPDMGDGELGRRLHDRYFQGVPLERYEGAFLGGGEAGPGEGAPSRGSDPLDIRGEGPGAMDPVTRALALMDAQNAGLVRYERARVSVPFAWAAAAGLVLCLAGGALWFRPRRGAK